MHPPEPHRKHYNPTPKHTAPIHANRLHGYTRRPETPKHHYRAPEDCEAVKPWSVSSKGPGTGRECGRVVETLVQEEGKGDEVGAEETSDGEGDDGVEDCGASYVYEAEETCYLFFVSVLHARGRCSRRSR
jgi:hypothetical protein